MDHKGSLDERISHPTPPDITLIPKGLLTRLESWQWGRYGWKSPTTVIIASTWKKVCDPTQDICKLWAVDESGKAIEGGYSFRRWEESVTVPIFAKHGLHEGEFCSANGGFQGARALEKSRSLRRLERKSPQVQTVLWNWPLFAEILNDINALSHAAVSEVMNWLIHRAISYHNERKSSASAIKNTTARFPLLEFLALHPDPELTKCIAAAALTSLLESPNYCLSGLTDYKTASDIQADKAGDLALISTTTNLPLAAFEIKAASQSLDWNNIARARETLQAHISLKYFVFILERMTASTNAVVEDLKNMDASNPAPIHFINLEILFTLSLMKHGHQHIADLTANYILKAPSIKSSTVEAWKQALTSQ